jgi:phosphatidylserine decarboxylase
MYRIHKEGKKLLLLSAALFSLIFAGLTVLLPNYPGVAFGIGGFELFIFLILLQFFRIPQKNIVKNPLHILAPADGKIVVIEETEETEYFKDKRIQVSIFMSPINVHNNLNPISGIVKYFRYHPGKFLVAWHPKSSTENERTTTVIQRADGQEVLFRQIAGALAKRICWYIKEGVQVEQGQEFGFIKFGSRVDIFLPLGTKITCELNQKSVGGETVIAHLA